MSVLVAGIGNVFRGDDGFGCEVVRRFARGRLPDGVRAVDFGTGGIHLAFELLGGGYERLVLVDAAERGDPPATLTVLEADVPAVDAETPGEEGGAPDGHGLDPLSVLRLVRRFGADVPRTVVLACEPETTDWRLGLSDAVERSVGEALDVLEKLVADGAKESRSPEARRELTR